MPQLFDEPLVVQVEVTNRCNLTCRICPRDTVGELGDLPRARLVRLLEDFQRPPGEVYLSGHGEPLLHPEIDGAVRDCLEHGVERTVIYTNGTILTPARADRLAAAGLTELRLSVDGSDQETLARVRPGVGLDRLVRHMQHVTRDGRMATALQFTATSETLHSLPGLPALAARMGVTRLFVVDVLPFADESPDGVFLATPDRRVPLMADADRTALLEEFRRRAGEEGMESVELLDSTKQTCDSPFSMLYVTWRGDVTPCCRIRSEVLLGNVGDTTMCDVWHGPAMHEWRDHLWSGDPPAVCRKLCQLPAAAAGVGRAA